MSDADGQPGQRREHVRVELSKRCTVRLFGYPEAEVMMDDLSGTGCGFHTWLPAEPGMRGRMRIPFADWWLEVPIIVRYMRHDPGKGKYVGISFEGLTRTEVDDVVREVFSELRRQLRNRRIVE